MELPLNCLSVGQRDDLATGAGGQRRHDRGGRVGEKVRGAVGEKEVRTAGVQAPEVESITLVLDAAAAKRIWTRPAFRPVAADVALLHAEHHVAGTVLRLPLPS